MSIASSFYNAIIRRNSIFVGVIFGTAFFYDIGFNKAVNKYWDTVNQGKQWKDIRSRYIKEGDDDEEDDE